MLVLGTPNTLRLSHGHKSIPIQTSPPPPSTYFPTFWLVGGVGCLFLGPSDWFRVGRANSPREDFDSHEARRVFALRRAEPISGERRLSPWKGALCHFRVTWWEGKCLMLFPFPKKKGVKPRNKAPSRKKDARTSLALFVAQGAVLPSFASRVFRPPSTQWHG